MSKKTRTAVTITRPNGRVVEMTNKGLGDLVGNFLDHLTLQGRKLTQKKLYSKLSDQLRKDYAQQFLYVFGFANVKAEAVDATGEKWGKP